MSAPGVKETGRRWRQAGWTEKARRKMVMRNGLGYVVTEVKVVQSVRSRQTILSILSSTLGKVCSYQRA